MLNKEHNISSLESFYKANQKEMSLLHHSFLLYKVNQVFKEIKKKSALGPKALQQHLEETGHHHLENYEQAQIMASSIYKQVCFHLNRNVKQLDIVALQTTLNSVSQGTDLDKSELTRAALEEMERKVIDDFPRFMSLDLASIIGSFLKLHYIPHSILNELNQMQALSFNKYACLVILESLVQESYNDTPELYDKLYAQLQKNSANMNTKLVNRTLSILLKYKEIFKTEKDVTGLVQFYIDRFNDSVKLSEKQIETEVCLHALENVIALQKIQRTEGTSKADFETQLFIENCHRLLEDRIEKLKPETFLRSFESFEEPKMKQKYINSMIKAMKDNKFDIRRFNFTQLC